MLILDGQLSLANAVLTVSLCMSLLYVQCVDMPPSVWRMATKTASTATLSALSALQGGPGLLSAALLLGVTGDAFLAWDGDGAFLSGLGSFLAAHLLYIVLFAQSGYGKAVVLNSGVRIVAATLLVCAFAPMMVSELMPKVNRDLRLPILVYTGAIIMMVLTALTLDEPLVIMGALLFTVSDAILSAEKFLVPATSKNRWWMPYAVWVLYYAGQLLIVLGFVG
ncbi:YhhN-like protein [Coniochaeta sp. PMI_546]|nr:YhhN-like protein [Coniochaeta sp. PMI_546]